MFLWGAAFETVVGVDLEEAAMPPIQTIPPHPLPLRREGLLYH